MLLPGKAGGAAAARRTLATTICRIADPMLVARPRQLRDASTVMRFRPAHQSMINRRHDGRASCLARYSPKQALERKPRIYAPATWKGGHGSGSLLTLASAQHGGEDGVGGFGPDEWLGHVVGFGDEAADGGLKLDDRSED